MEIIPAVFQIPDFFIEFAVNQQGIGIKKHHPNDKKCKNQEVSIAKYPEPLIAFEFGKFHLRRLVFG
jgi:hypothetical protein